MVVTVEGWRLWMSGGDGWVFEVERVAGMETEWWGWIGWCLATVVFSYGDV